MYYKIYEVVEEPLLRKLEQDGYDVKTAQGLVLRELSDWHIEGSQPTAELALAEVERNKDRLTGCKVTVLPIVQINYDGTIFNSPE